MALDYTLPLQVKAADPNLMLSNASQYADYFTKMKTDGELSRIYKESQGDLDKMLSIAPQSKMARWIMPQLQSQKAAAYEAQLGQQKALADIGKVQSEAFKNNTQGQGYSLDNSGKRQAAIENVIQQAAMTGDPGQVLIGLNRLAKTGLITPEQYQQETAIVQTMTPEELQKYAQGSALTNKEVAPYLYQTQNNAADNETSRFNNAATVGATLSGQQVQKEIAAANREQAAQKTELKDIGGYQAIFYPQTGEYDFVRDANGQPMKSQQKSTGQPKLSDKALISVNEANVQIATATQNLNKVQGIIKDINDGKLNLNAASQGGAWLMNRVGLSDENTRGIENFKTALNQAANDVLMMAKGTQTEGDAKRALETIAANPPRDNNAALQVLQRLATIQQNTINILNSNVDGVYQNYGIPRPQANNAPQPSDKNAGQGKPNARSFFD